MKRFLTICLGLITTLIVVASFGASGNTDRSIRIGAPSDTAGLLASMVVEDSGLKDLTIVGGIETFPINDCCTPVAQWAMTSESVDLALMCPDSAAALIKKDDRFVIVGPILYNAEVIVFRPAVNVHSAGVAQGRTRQATLLKSVLGDDASISPMLPASLPFAYEKEVVDAVVVDFFTSLTLSGKTTSLAPHGKRNLSYVLVVRKSIQASPGYSKILEAFEKAAKKSSVPEELRLAVRKHKKMSLNNTEVQLWETMRVQFVSPTSTPTNSLKL